MAEKVTKITIDNYGLVPQSIGRSSNNSEAVELVLSAGSNNRSVVVTMPFSDSGDRGFITELTQHLAGVMWKKVDVTITIVPSESDHD